MMLMTHTIELRSNINFQADNKSRGFKRLYFKFEIKKYYTDFNLWHEILVCNLYTRS